MRRAGSRRLFGAPLADLQLTQAALAEMATAVDASALLVYRAAWTKDGGAPRVTREAAMAKMHATEAAQGVIDKAVQIFGGLGVAKGVKVEELYREIRALRIYEGATEVQKIVIARELLKPSPAQGEEPARPKSAPARRSGSRTSRERGVPERSSAPPTVDTFARDNLPPEGALARSPPHPPRAPVPGAPELRPPLPRPLGGGGQGRRALPRRRRRDADLRRKSRSG